MKKFLYFGEICLYVLGVVGGIGATIYSHSYPCTVGVIALGVMAFPEVKKAFNKLME